MRVAGQLSVTRCFAIATDTTLPDLFVCALPFAATLLHLLVAPYTKVEESFSLQATHDILRHGLPTRNVTAVLTANYDHLQFSGAVPRSFIGPLVLSQVAAPFVKLFGSFVNAQVIGKPPQAHIHARN